MIRAIQSYYQGFEQWTSRYGYSGCKRIFLFILCGFSLLTAQTQEIQPTKIRCATYESMQDFRRRHPAAETDQQFEAWLNSKIQERTRSGRTESVAYTIPIIFHIVHNGENPGTGSNLSASKIAAQLEQLNKDFANQSGSTYPAAANIEIQFCLALVAPDGSTLAEPGIERINLNDRGWPLPPYSTYIPNTFVFNPFNTVDWTIIPQTIWTPRKYFNVWTMGLSDVYGLATYPRSSTLSGLFTISPDTDEHSGVYLDYLTVGSKTNAGGYGQTQGLGRTLSHETGHFLGLRHIWGDGHCNNDYCNDTPVQADETSGCPTTGHTQFLQNCPDPGDGFQRMFENYMDYTDDACMNTFTSDQKIRMQTVMAHSPRRVELATSTVCCPSADLIVTNPGANPNSTVAGNTITLSFAEKNQGHSSAGANYINVHLSEDDILTPGLNGDLYLGQYHINQVLLPEEETAQLSLPVTIPALTPAGNYYIFFAADGTGVVNECVENNNFASTIISVSDVQAPAQAACRYWFDASFINAVYVNTSIAANHIYLQRNVSALLLQPGLHSFHFQFKDTADQWSSVSSTFFYKNNGSWPAGSARYEYWTDTDFENRVITTLNNSATLIVLNEFAFNESDDGLHTINFRFKPDGKHWSSVITSFFYKSRNTISGPAQYEYWFDDSYATKTSITISPANNFILLDSIHTAAINNGLHSLHFRFKTDGKEWSPAISSFFYKDNSNLVPLNNLAKFIYWYDNNWQAPKTISIIGASTINWTLNTDAAELSAGRHNLSMSYKDDRGNWSSIVSDSFTRAAITAPACLTGNRQFTSGVLAGPGTAYQWQADTGAGFSNISDNSTYTGTTSDLLQISNAPTSWYGYKYRCIVTNGANLVTGETYTLKFITTWNGPADNIWENPANWSCNTVPDENTDVYINAGMPVYPRVNSNAACRKIYLQPGTSIEVKPGKTLLVTGKDQQ
jgi:Pregnancy-associated plasma protein-A/CARDB